MENEHDSDRGPEHRSLNPRTKAAPREAAGVLYQII